VAEIVNRIIDQRIEDGQLNESGLTLQDIETIKDVFASALKGTFHPRIKYPEPKVEKPVAETEPSQAETEPSQVETEPSQVVGV
jgi:hypothetical protein